MNTVAKHAGITWKPCRRSASAFRLKGSGWYETDFKTGNKKNVVQADKAGSSGSQSGSKPGSTASTKKSTSS
jgi:predicted nucleic acid-binding Zn ribbon protein